ncbi:MAG TPA: hypothetical protein VF549_08680 [Solirubrobacteraceae bacterium]|jgi:hypothetical protein
MDEREPDLTDDPREHQDERQDSQGGYPAGEDRSGSGGDSAPDTDAGQDESPGGATGNPGAAGG